MVNQTQVNEYIQELSKKLGFSFENFLCPPVRNCIICPTKTELSKNHNATQVVVCTSEGLKSGTSFQYRCRTCMYVYSYDTYSKGDHRFFYNQERTLVKASRLIFIERTLMDFWQQLSLHSQVSFESIAICYNSTFKAISPFVSAIFHDYNDDNDDNDNDIGDKDDQDEIDNNFLRTQLNRKQVASATWTYLIEKTSRNQGLLGDPLVGTKREAEDSFMDKVETIRKASLLPHSCTEECRQRACDKSTSMDGIWKCRKF